MSEDYLDLLLDRATGSLPLAEPRITPATTGPSVTPQWEESTEESVRPYMAATNAPPQEVLETLEVSKTIRDVGHVDIGFHPQEIFPRETTSPLNGTPRGASQPVTPPSVITVREEQREQRSSGEGSQKSAPSILDSDMKAPLPAIDPRHIAERTIPTQRWFPKVEPLDSDHPLHQPLTMAVTQVQAEQPAPISIRIDRIEVRAGGPAPRITSAPKPLSPAPLSLDEYLKRKNGGAR